jgi:glutaconate CoA-transferase, subunit A
LATEQGTADYIRDFVASFDDIDSYLDMIGRENIATLSQSSTSFLLDPYRKWILSPEQIAEHVTELAA